MTRLLNAAMQDFNPVLPLAVAYSGGADSTALLLACAEKWPGQVAAVHVNHGLQEAAGAFESHCRGVCSSLHIPLLVQTVDAGHAPGQSPEDAARRARYKAFSALALMDAAQAAIKSIALAQHADDQVETILLALSRGAGLGGLSAMPAHWRRDSLDFHRPLLAVSAQEIRVWLAQRGASFIEDPTNQNQQFTRNRIRAQILPVLAAVFPQFRDTLSRSAVHAAQAQELLQELGAQDLADATNLDGLPLIKSLQALSHARQANTLRYWLKTGYSVLPSTAQLAELLSQVSACTTRGHRIDIKVGPGFVRRSGAVLAWYNPEVLL
jgi:tRNA(Ile)-lysidine synthase